MVKKLLLIWVVCLGLIMPMVVSTPVSASTNPIGSACSNVPTNADGSSQSSICNQANSVNQKSQNPVATTIHDVANILAIIIGVIAVFMIIISGITYITSRGNSDTVTQSRNRIIYALVGLAVTAMAWSITVFFTNHLG